MKASACRESRAKSRPALLAAAAAAVLAMAPFRAFCAPVLTITQSCSLPMPYTSTGCTLYLNLNVVNTGDTTAQSISVWDSIPAGLEFIGVTGPSCTCYGSMVVCKPGGTLGPGVEIYPKISIYVRASATGIQANKVEADYSDGSTWYNSTNTYNVTIVDPVLSLSIGTAATIYSAGQTLTYNLVFGSLGMYPGKNIRIWDTLPPGAEFISLTANTGTAYVSDGLFMWTMPVGLPAALGTLSVKVPDLCGTLYPNTFCVQGETDCDALVPVNSVTHNVTVQNARINLVKVADKTSVLQGDTLTYTITGQNDCEDDATSVVLVDTLPAGTAFVSATGGLSSTFDGTKIVWNLPTIKNFAKYGNVISVSFTVTVTGAGPVIGPNLAMATYRNKASLPQTSFSNPLNVPISNPDLKLYVSSPASVISGQPVTFGMTLRNEGTATALGVVLVDTLPTPLYVVEATEPYSGDKSLVSWFFGDMLPGEEKSVFLIGRGIREEVDRIVVNQARGLCVNQLGVSVPGQVAANSVALLVILREPKVYPSPYNPAKAVRGTMKFSELPPGSTVTILTISGVKVRKLEGVTANRLEWDGKNEDGTPVAPGMYLYLIEVPEGDGTRVVKGKFGLTR